MFNNVTLEGRLARNPEIQLTQRGMQLAKFSIATSTLWQDGTREWHKQTHWHKIVVSRESTVRWIKDTLKQGDLVHVEGTLIYRHWKDAYGQRRRTAQIIVSEEKGHVEDHRFKNLESEEPVNLPDIETPSENFNTERLDLETVPFLSHQSLQQQ